MAPKPVSRYDAHTTSLVVNTWQGEFPFATRGSGEAPFKIAKACITAGVDEATDYQHEAYDPGFK
jgi:hypothetical protein